MPLFDYVSAFVKVTFAISFVVFEANLFQESCSTTKKHSLVTNANKQLVQCRIFFGFVYTFGVLLSGLLSN